MSEKTAEKSSTVIIPSLPPFSNGKISSTTSATPAAPTTPNEPPGEKCFSQSSITSISDDDLEKLKDHIRVCKGMKVTSPPIKKRTSSACKTPRRPPRPTATSKVRAEIRKYRLILRCEDLIKYHTGQYSEYYSDGKPLTAEEEQSLFNKARDLTAEEILVKKQRAEVDYLKYLAAKTRTNTDFRPNRASDLRFKYIRGEPVISSYYEESYDYHEKLPFMVAARYRPLPFWKLPPIDKKKETWLIPQDDGDTPLHTQPKEEPKKSKRKALRKKEKRKTVKRREGSVYKNK